MTLAVERDVKQQINLNGLKVNDYIGLFHVALMFDIMCYLALKPV